MLYIKQIDFIDRDLLEMSSMNYTVFHKNDTHVKFTEMSLSEIPLTSIEIPETSEPVDSVCFLLSILNCPPYTNELTNPAICKQFVTKTNHGSDTSVNKTTNKNKALGVYTII